MIIKGSDQFGVIIMGVHMSLPLISSNAFTKSWSNIKGVSFCNNKFNDLDVTQISHFADGVGLQKVTVHIDTSHIN